MKAGIAIGIAIIVLGVGYIAFTNKSTDEASQALPPKGDAMMDEGDAMMDEGSYDVDAMMEGDDAVMKEDGDIIMEKGLFTHSGTLEDVSGGNSSGDVKAGFAEGKYELVATFEGLPEPQGTDFYEGWVVRRGDAMSVISTGRVDEEEIGYVNLFNSDTDLTDHDFYVLTIEPDDGDPAPAEHILEGVLTRS
jgi:hypothetical protein